MCIFSHQKFPFHLKVKVCYRNYTIVIIGDQKLMINLIQFEATNATNVTLHPHMQAI